jgi:PAS domain S-box-containing protein
LASAGHLSVEEANRRLNDLVRLTSDIVWEADRDFQILSISNSVLKATGLLPQDLLGKTLADFWKPEPSVDLSALKPFRDVPTKMNMQGQKTGHFLLSGLPVFNKAGEFVNVRGLLKDISPRVEAQQALLDYQKQLEDKVLRRTQDLEYADRSKSEFLANMSHELRTPLNAVIGFSQALLAGLGGSLSDKQTEYIKDIQMSGDHLLSLINDVLDLSKIEAGKSELHEEEFVVDEMIDQTIRLVKQRAFEKDISLRVAASPSMALKADIRMCKQMLSNLLSNAIKFTPASGSVDVSVRLDPNGWAEISVSDSGIGMSDQEIEKAFEKFGQIEGDLSREEKGTGLGLPLVLSQIELHGGSIEVQSTVGKGTTMSIRFPPDRLVKAEQHSLF